MQEWLIQLAHSHQYIVYAIIIVLACAEGPTLSLICGVLIKLGYFLFLPIYIALMVGDLIGDTIWYYLGRRYGHRFIKRFGRYFNVTEESVVKVEKIFHKYKHPILFISKISNGFGFSLVTLFTAGMVKIPFGLYISINFIGQFIWTGLLLGVGYFFGHIYTQVNNWLGRIFIIALFILVLLVLWGYKKYLGNKAKEFKI